MFLKRFIPLLSVLLLLVCLMAPCVYAIDIPPDIELPFSFFVDPPVSVSVSVVDGIPGFSLDSSIFVLPLYDIALQFSSSFDDLLSAFRFGVFIGGNYYVGVFLVNSPFYYFYIVDPILFTFDSLPSDSFAYVVGFSSLSDSDSSYSFMVSDSYSLPASFDLNILFYGDTAPLDPAPDLPPSPGGSGLVDQLGDVSGTFLQTCIGIADKIVSTPLLLFTVGIFFLGGAVGIFGRILGRD